MPDPNAVSTFIACKLRCEEREQTGHRARLSLIQQLIELRRQHLVPPAARFSHAGRYWVINGLLHLVWTLPSGDAWSLQANFTAQPREAEAPPEAIFAAGVEAISSSKARIASGGVIAA